MAECFRSCHNARRRLSERCPSRVGRRAFWLLRVNSGFPFRIHQRLGSGPNERFAIRVERFYELGDLFVISRKVSQGLREATDGEVTLLRRIFSVRLV